MTAENDPYDQAHAANTAFKAEVAAVQRQLWTEEWLVGVYGDVPTACADGYGFRVTRTLPTTDDWRFPADPEDLRDRLSSWLEQNGYADVIGLSYTGDVDTLTLTARKPEAGVAELTVQFHPGEAHDGISVSASSTCTPGDVDAVAEALYPGLYTDTTREWPLPEVERPDATPVFGFDAEGAARR